MDSRACVFIGEKKEEEESYEDMEWSTRTSTNITSKSPSQRLSSRSEGPPKLPERPSSRLLPRPVKWVIKFTSTPPPTIPHNTMMQNITTNSRLVATMLPN
jgi:hypothetical protein